MDTTNETTFTVEQHPPVMPDIEPPSTTDTVATTVALDTPISDAPESSTDQMNNTTESPLLVPERNALSQGISAEAHEPPIRSDTSAPPRPPPPEVEHAYWAEMEEDTSVPDEAEMKEIESAADGDYSAYECESHRITVGSIGKHH